MPATAVRENPILFNGEMVRAILDGRKTQTRRVVKLPTGCLHDDIERASAFWNCFCDPGHQWQCGDDLIGPNYQPGDRLWCKETWAVRGLGYDMKPSQAAKIASRDAWVYRADGTQWQHGWKPSILMPRAASRLTLEITDVRVERLQSITEADAIAEGAYALSEDGMSGYGDDATLHRFPHYTYRWGFKDIWDSINAKSHPWDANPWVWVVSFKRA